VPGVPVVLAAAVRIVAAVGVIAVAVVLQEGTPVWIS
jgi:hypothetical protein